MARGDFGSVRIDSGVHFRRSEGRLLIILTTFFTAVSSFAFAGRRADRRGSTALVPCTGSVDSAGASSAGASTAAPSTAGSASVDGLVEVLARGEIGNIAMTGLRL